MEVLKAYSHTPERLDELRKAVETLRRHESDDGRNEAASRPSLWNLTDRLSPEDVQTIIDLHTSGATRAEVAERFGISVSSMKRVLRAHSIREQSAVTQS